MDLFQRLPPAPSDDYRLLGRLARADRTLARRRKSRRGLVTLTALAALACWLVGLVGPLPRSVGRASALAWVELAASALVAFVLERRGERARRAIASRLPTEPKAELAARP
jgi:hypothetical protein